jgi:hypothetical protein
VATWEELRQYIGMTQRVDENSGEDWVTFVLATSGDRMQQVFVSKMTLDDGKEEWAVIESPFGEIDKIDLAKALQELSALVCGGLGLFQGNLVTLRHAVPLASLDAQEFDRPLMLVTTAADLLEDKLSGSDRF